MHRSSPGQRLPFRGGGKASGGLVETGKTTITAAANSNKKNRPPLLTRGSSGGERGGLVNMLLQRNKPSMPGSSDASASETLTTVADESIYSEPQSRSITSSNHQHNEYHQHQHQHPHEYRPPIHPNHNNNSPDRRRRPQPLQRRHVTTGSVCSTTSGRSGSSTSRTVRSMPVDVDAVHRLVDLDDSGPVDLDESSSDSSSSLPAARARKIHQPPTTLLQTPELMNTSSASSSSEKGNLKDAQDEAEECEGTLEVSLSRRDDLEPRVNDHDSCAADTMESVLERRMDERERVKIFKHVPAPAPLFHDDEYDDDFDFSGYEFPILDEREFSRGIVGYLKGCEPPVDRDASDLYQIVEAETQHYLQQMQLREEMMRSGKSSKPPPPPVSSSGWPRMYKTTSSSHSSGSYTRAEI